jgi:hypothetical protein
MTTPNEEGQFPGYPHYPEGEDIMNLHNGTRTNLDPDNGQPKDKTKTPAPKTEEPGTADVSREERQSLSAAYQNRDIEDPDAEENGLDRTDEDGDPLNEASGSYGSTGSDLDVPGSEDDDADEAAGSEDEENNYYSLGGDNHTDLEEDNNI